MTTVAIIGLGYVGLPLCLLMSRAGCRVLGVDCDPKKVEALARGESYLKHLGADEVAAMCAAPNFEPTTDAGRIAEADAVIICVPTPLDAEGEPDLSHVEATARDITAALRRRGRSQIIILESTSWPGTTREVVKPILDQAGVPYHLAFSPERVDPGRSEPPIEATPKVVGGIDTDSTKAAAELYRRVFTTVVPVSSPEVAEAAKLMENIYRAVNIALVNEMKVVLDRMNVNVWEVIDAAATKPFGFSPFYPGPGLGGHCIPIDPFYFAWRAKQLGAEARFVELAGEVNRSMPQRVVDVALDAWRSQRGAGVDDRPKRVLILGLAYKPNIDDVRESPSFELIRLFRERGADVDYADPHVPSTHPMRHYGDLRMSSVTLTPEALASYDLVVVSTAHRAFDWPMIAKHARLIIDTRNALADHPQANVVRA